jgi:hypothetical protein
VHSRPILIPVNDADDKGEFALSQQLWLGTAKLDITPEHPLPLAGFATRHGLVFEAVRHPLHARFFIFRHCDAEGNETRALLVSADLLWWGSERVPELKRRIRERWGIAEDAILFHGTHNHSGPQTSDRFSEYLGAHDPNYLRRLEAKVMEGVEAAVGSQEPVRMERGGGQVVIGINRRLMVNGVCQFQANKDGPLDPQVRVVRFLTRSGRTKGALVHYACHPTVTLENAVSSEFCGVAMDRLEQSIGDGAVCAYLQGFCADINPVRNGELFLDGTDEDVQAFAGKLADEVRRVLAGAMQPLDPCPLTVRTLTVPAPLQPLPSLEELRQTAGEPWVKGEWSRKLLAEPERLQPFLPLEMTLLGIADGWALLAANSEVVTEYGLEVNRLTDNQVWPVGYTNGMIGYIPTAKQIDEGGYESYWSTEYFMMPARFDHAVETVFRQAVRRLTDSFLIG